MNLVEHKKINQMTAQLSFVRVFCVQLRLWHTKGLSATSYIIIIITGLREDIELLLLFFSSLIELIPLR